MFSHTAFAQNGWFIHGVATLVQRNAALVQRNEVSEESATRCLKKALEASAVQVAAAAAR